MIHISELLRKLLHLSNLIIPFTYLFYFNSKVEALIVLLPITLFSLLIEYLRINSTLVKLFFDKLDDVDAKNLRQLLDECKKDIKSGIVCLIATYEGKSSIAIGVTNDLLNNYDAVNLVKTSSEILGGKGGGGRKDMALAGAKDVTKSEDVFEQLLKEIKKDS